MSIDNFKKYVVDLLPKYISIDIYIYMTNEHKKYY